jgi:chromosome segregation ATPase
MEPTRDQKEEMAKALRNLVPPGHDEMSDNRIVESIMQHNIEMRKENSALRQRQAELLRERDAWREAFDVLIGKCDAFTQLCGNIEYRLEKQPDDLDTIRERIRAWRSISESVTQELNEMYSKYPPDHAVDQT